LGCLAIFDGVEILHKSRVEKAGPSPFEARRRGERLRGTERKLGALLSPRHCERSEAIQSLAVEAVWIASLRSQ